ncbi:MAG: DNA-processing protein DprA, partial [Actinomycetaceae bacterium]|nr:DNA-processing protein DprA [Actinomycetaceae bacterium]
MAGIYRELYNCVTSEREAAMAFTRLAEGKDVQAVEFVEKYGYLGAYRAVLAFTYGRGLCPSGYEKSLPRWANRLDAHAFMKDRQDIEKLGGDFTYPGAENWVGELDALGSLRPLGLWYLGELDNAFSPCVSFVGSRDCTDYGRALARDFAYELAASGLTIVSGGALGIDTAAHEGALSVGRTIVVFANGLGSLYPSKNLALFQSVLDSGGLLLSESPPDARPHRYRFLSRNRLIAALGLVTVVVEAPYRSGALSTAHYGLEIGKDVCAVPGSVFSPHSTGCHRLLREGGICVTRVEEIMELLPEYVRNTMGKTPVLELGTRKTPRNTEEKSAEPRLFIADPLAER